MKPIIYPYINKLFTLVIIVLAVFTTSCEDEDVNCSKLAEQYGDTANEVLDAFANEDCNGIEDAYEKFIKIARKGKSCSFIKSAMDGYGADNINELEEALLEERDGYLNESGCND